MNSGTVKESRIKATSEIILLFDSEIKRIYSFVKSHIMRIIPKLLKTQHPGSKIGHSIYSVIAIFHNLLYDSYSMSRMIR